MHIVNQLDNSAVWAETNPNTCPCGGSGWLLSDYDTFHRCHIHGGTPHPEDERDDFDWKAHRCRLLVKAYETFLAASDLSVAEFGEACLEVLDGEPTLSNLVDAADTVATRIAYERREEAARAEGYSCGLERDLAWEAEREASEGW